jgi:hypothetical protein
MAVSATDRDHDTIWHSPLSNPAFFPGPEDVVERLTEPRPQAPARVPATQPVARGRHKIYPAKAP